MDAVEVERLSTLEVEAEAGVQNTTVYGVLEDLLVHGKIAVFGLKTVGNMAKPLAWAWFPGASVHLDSSGQRNAARFGVCRVL